MTAPDTGGRPPSEKPAPDESSPGPGALGLVTIGTVNATCWLAGIFVGWLCDRHFGTTPVFILVGLVIGSVTGALSTYKEVRRYLSS
jgi:hypothetical protein